MQELFQYYELLKSEYNNENYLKTCNELYNNSKYKNNISIKLKQLGFTCTKEQEAILFFALVDIIVVVDAENNFYYATFSENKIYELIKENRLIPRKDDIDLNKSRTIISSNTVDVINKYLASNKFHLIKLNRLDCNAFFCSVGTMNPYPSIVNEKVYASDFISKSYWSICGVLVRGLYKVGDLVCSISPRTTQGRKINNCALDCKINVKTLNGVLESIYLWDIVSITEYTKSDKLKPLYEGVCRVGNTLVTLNRDILERYYGLDYLYFESQSVRERYCLEEILGKSDLADLRYYVGKYHFYKDKEIISCKNISDLRRVLSSRLKPIQDREGYINLRVLVSPKQIYAKHRSYYKATKIDSDFEVITDIDSIMPKTYKVSGVCSVGYTFVEVLANNEENAIINGKAEFIRQFGSIYDNKVLGLQCGNEACKNYNKVFKISIDTQRKVCQLLRWGYTQHYDEYSKYIRGIIESLNIELDISDSVIQLLFINNIARRIGKCKNITMEMFGLCIEEFVNMLSNCTQEELDNKVNIERNKLSKRN